MPRINLLPWRETLEKERRQRFFAIFGASMAVTLLVFGSVYLYIEGMISYQGNRNGLLQEEIKKAEAKIEEIKALDEQKAALVKRMEAIQGLEEIRPLVVHLFDELVRKVPDGVYFNSMKQLANKITLGGIAQSDARVSSLMTNLESSEWLKSPKIMVIQKEELKTGKNEKTKRSVSKFELEIKQKLPPSAEPEKVEVKPPPPPPPKEEKKPKP
jgi:type IV pilus assembly protein PilN